MLCSVIFSLSFFRIPARYLSRKSPPFLLKSRKNCSAGSSIVIHSTAMLQFLLCFFTNCCNGIFRHCSTGKHLLIDNFPDSRIIFREYRYSCKCTILNCIRKIPKQTSCRSLIMKLTRIRCILVFHCI